MMESNNTLPFYNYWLCNHYCVKAVEEVAAEASACNTLGDYNICSIRPVEDKDQHLRNALKRSLHDPHIHIRKA